MMHCNKCNSNSSVTLRKKDHYCNDCFIIGTNHKFRACIGKNKILSKNDKVLIGASGGPGSTVLLDLVHTGLSLDVHKKIRIVPYVLHVKEVADSSNISSLIKLCRLYNFDLYIVPISDYITSSKKLPDVNTIPTEKQDEVKKFQSILNGMPSTASNDFVKKVKRSLFIHYAELLQCKYVFNAETTTSLAINLLSNIAIGRGAQIQNNVGFIDSCDQNIKILRPMKDISQEELDYYIKIKGLLPSKHKDLKSNSLQTAISSFVTELQDNFQSTISTVCKTADKIGVTNSDNADPNCSICKNPLTIRKLKLSALDATNFSKTVSFGEISGNNHVDTMFPLIDEHLCYSCSRNYSEMKPSDLTCLPNLIRNK